MNDKIWPQDLTKYASLWEVELMETFWPRQAALTTRLAYASLWEVELMETCFRNFEESAVYSYASLWEVELMETFEHFTCHWNR